MRFQELLLLCYGPFTNQRLIFPKEKNDLHIIYGPNEAGKSTTHKAIRDFLFAFPKGIDASSVWNHHVGSSLRVGATLEHHGESFTGIRRRPVAKKPSLFDKEDKTPLPHTFIDHALGFLNPMLFENQWSLDHTRLRHGGHKLVQCEDDTRLSFLEESTGIKTISETLKELDIQKKKYWTSRKSKAHIHTIRTRIKTLKQELKKIMIRPKDLTKHEEAFKKADSIYQSLEEDITQLVERHKENSFYLSIRSSYQQVVRYKNTLIDRSPILFSEQEINLIKELLAQNKDAEKHLYIAEERITAHKNNLAPLGPPHPIISDCETIIKLQQAEQQHNSLHLERQQRQEKLIALQKKKQHYLTQLSLSENDVLPQPSDLEPLTDHVAAYHALRTKQQERQRTLSNMIPSADLSSLPIPDPKRMAFLEKWLEHSHSLEHQLNEHTTLKNDILQKERYISSITKRLLPWKPQTDNFTILYNHLIALSLPSEEECLYIHNQFQTKSDHIKKVSLSIIELQKNIDLISLKYDHLINNQHWISEETLYHARQERDLFIKDTLQKSPFTPSKISHLWEHLYHVDRLSDQRTQTSHIDNEIKNIIENKKRLLLELHHLEEEKKYYITLLKQQKEEWKNRLLQDNLPFIYPVKFSSWRQNYHLIITHIEELQKVQHQYNTLKEKGRSLTQELAKILQQEPLKRLPLSEAISHAEHEHILLKEQHRRYEHQLQEEEHIKKTRHHHEHALREAQHELDEWTLQWQKRIAQIHYPRHLTPEDLPIFQELVNTHHNLQEFASLCHHDKAEEEDIKHQQAQLLHRYHCLTTEELYKTLQNALDIDQKRRNQQAALHETQRHYQHYCSEQKQAHVHLRPFMKRLNLDEEWSQLHEKIDYDLKTYSYKEAYNQAQHDLVSQGKGASFDELMTLMGSLDLNELDLRAEEFNTRYLELTKARDQARDELKKSREILDKFEKEDHAVHLSAEIESLTAELHQNIEIYMSLHLQYTLLQHMIRQQREQKYGPLLERASGIFQRLTLGEFERFTTDITDKNEPYILAIRTSSQTPTLISQMSEGTRDQAYLALRLAHLEQSHERNLSFPFIADDLFITFDEKRARAGLEVLAEFSRHTQVLFFTHHRRLTQLGEDLGHVLSIA